MAPLPPTTDTLFVDRLNEKPQKEGSWAHQNATPAQLAAGD